MTNMQKGIAVVVAVLLFAVAMAGCLDDNGNGDEEPRHYTYDGADFMFDRELSNVSYFYKKNNTTSVRLFISIYNIADNNSSAYGTRLEIRLYVDDIERISRNESATWKYYRDMGNRTGAGQRNHILLVKYLLDGEYPFGGVVKIKLKLIFEGVTIDKMKNPRVIGNY